MGKSAICRAILGVSRFFRDKSPKYLDYFG